MKQYTSDNLANERTFLAYLRTSLALVGFGFVIARFGLYVREIAEIRSGVMRSSASATEFGVAMVLAGVAIAAFGFFRYEAVARALATGNPMALTARGAAVLVGIFAIFGVVVAYYLYRSSVLG